MSSTRRAATSAEVRTLGEARRQFWLRPSPRWLLAAFLALVAARLTMDAPDWRDAAAVAAICAIYPFGEWAIHLYLLHLPPLRIRGRRVELPTAAAHRTHHEDPHRLDGVLLGALEGVLLLLGGLPLVVFGGGALVALVTGPVPASALVSAWLAAALLVFAYEWSHFLIHTAHRPRSRYFAAIHRQHRLHHFKNEHFWHGVTSTVGDRVFGTAPDHREVGRSRTARTLHTDRG